jgi:glycosyltransferase involved in cell wall biosynthesis
MTTVAILTQLDPKQTGGQERLINDLKSALSADLVYTTVGKWKDWYYFSDAINFWRMRKEVHDSYDVVIGMDDLTARAFPDITYMTTPRRAFYDLYFSEPWYYKLPIPVLRQLDQHAIAHQTDIVAISHTTRSRIWKYYKKPATVINPCIHVNDHYWKPPEDYWLSVQRINKWKRVDAQVETFMQLPDLNLKIVGEGEYNRHVPKNVEFLGKVTRQELLDLYAHCRGFITTAIDEDFGLTPIEAMASGKFVVAPAEGGYLETVELGCGLLGSPGSCHLANMVQLVEDKGYDHHRCREQSLRYDYSVFKKSWNDVVSAVK